MKILMVGHSYVVALNRRLCREIALAGGDTVSVTVAAPRFVQGDLRPIALEPLEGEPYELVPIPMRLTRVPQLMTYGRALSRLIRQGDWDLVHAWQEPYTPAGLQVALATPRTSTFVISSFQNISKTFPPPFNWVERACLNRASGWTAFGQTVAEALRDRPGYRDRPMRIIPLGVDLEVFRPEPSAGQEIRRELGWAESGPPVVGYLGRFVTEKGLPLLLRVLERLDPGAWRALFVGSGPMEAELRDWASSQEDRVRVVTGVKHDDVPPYLNAMDMLVAPSQTTPRWREQLGRMLLEGMACGVPLVASDSGEIPHVVAEAGQVVPEKDEDVWLDALRTLLESPQRRDEFRGRGLARAREVYAWPHVARDYLSFFRELYESRLARTS